MKKKSISFLLIMILVLFITTSCGINSNSANQKETMGNNLDNINLEVHFIDVGQGDATLIKKGNEFALIDAGKNSDGESVVNYLKAQEVNKLKYVVGTHPHEDHIGGLDDVINTFEVEKVIMPNIIHNTKTFEDVLDSVKEKGLTITKSKVGDKYELNGAILTILAPNAEEYANLNNYSVGIKLVNGENAFVFTGDAEELSEREILKNNIALDADVLKLGHHGSNTSTREDFLDEVDPQFAVISVGEGNKYNHPNDEVLDRVYKRGMEVYRTDLQGTIISISDGKKIEFKTEVDHNIVVETIEDETIEDKTIPDVVISGLDKIDEIVTIKNNSQEDVDLTDWKLVSLTGNQEYVFPHYILQSEDTLTVVSGDIEGDLTWGRANIWNNSKSDPAILYDNKGNEVFKFHD